MRFMLLVKASDESEAGVMPTAELIADMGRFNESLVDAGVLLAGDGLHPSSKGARVQFTGRHATVVDGPFAEAKELVAGYWVLQVRSREEAIEWARRAPFDGGEIEVRQLFDTEDFAACDPTGELRVAEHRLRERVESQQGVEPGVARSS